jgi:RNA polymerase sigma factor (sigma-70 family)
MAVKLSEVLDFRNHPPKLQASIMVGDRHNTLCWVALPALIARHITLTVFHEEPELAARCFPDLIDESGRPRVAKVDQQFRDGYARQVEAAFHAAAENNSPVARSLVDYADQQGRPSESIEALVPALRRMVMRLGYAGADQDDASQTAILLLLQELQALRESREKLFETFFSARLNFIVHTVQSRVIDQFRAANAQKRTPRGLESLPDETAGDSDKLSAQFKEPSNSIEDVVVADDLTAKLLRLIAEEFPGESRIRRIVELRFEDPSHSSVDLARTLGVSKKTIDRDLANLRNSSAIAEFVRKFCHSHN